MKLKKIKVRNFRLLKETELDLRDDLSLLIGKNNTGKTSMLVLFEKFYNDWDFTFNDFHLSMRENILNIDETIDPIDYTIQMHLEIEYNEEDNLQFLSEFLLDLESENSTIKILFECQIKVKKLLKEITGNKSRFIRKNLQKFTQNKIFAYINENDTKKENRKKIVLKDIKQIKDFLNYQIIHAKRDVASSEGEKQVLSKITTQYYNKIKNKNDDYSKITELLLEFDEKLEGNYDEVFKTFLKTSKNFLELEDLKVISNLQSNEIIKGTSQVVYGNVNNSLPETYNGLGYMNILYLLLQIEIRKEIFKADLKGINLLFIEEPEAHTHPQMQYVFAEKIKNILKDIPNLQTLITTHSSHIVSQRNNFEDIRYCVLRKDGDFKKVEIKNFYSEMEKKYKEKNQESEFKFLNQYLSINAAELFFASKIIFIEGVSEKLLMPLFIKKYDEEYSTNKISSQHISILEVGANAKAFRHFLEFLEIKTLIITDIDTTQKNEDNKYKACEVSLSENISNYTIKYYLNAPKIKTDPENFQIWLEKLKKDELQDNTSNIRICYQTFEVEYQARSFEDAFINVNLAKIIEERENIKGLQNKNKLDNETNIYELTDSIIKSKSDFASSLLYLSLTENIVWQIPDYIREGLKWLAK